MTVAGVFIGKFIGGMIADRFTIKNAVLGSLIPAAVLFIPAINIPVLWSIDQLLINISMPITLFLMCRSMPERPGLAFGWAAACLLPGLLAPVIAEKFGTLTYAYIPVLFVNIALILFAGKELRKTAKTVTVVNEKENLTVKDS